MALGSSTHFLHRPKVGRYYMNRAYGTQIIHALFTPS
jgi:hypothetical protein